MNFMVCDLSVDSPTQISGEYSCYQVAQSHAVSNSKNKIFLHNTGVTKYRNALIWGKVPGHSDFRYFIANRKLNCKIIMLEFCTAVYGCCHETGT